MIDKLPAFKEKIIYERCRLYLKNLRLHCKKCKGTGIFTNEEGDSYKDCPDCHGKYYMYKDYLLSGIPFDYVELEASTIQKTYSTACFSKYMQMLKSVSLMQGKIVVLFKQVKKTWGISSLGMLLTKKALDASLFTAVAESPDLLYTFVDFSQDDDLNKARKTAQQYYENAQFLFIDNLEANVITKSKGNEGFFINKFIQLLNQRKSIGNTTILGLNLTKEEIKSEFPSNLYELLERNALWFRTESTVGRITEMDKLKGNDVLKGCFDEMNPVAIVKPIAGISIQKKANSNG